LRANLLEQISPFLGRLCCHQMLLGGSQDTLKPHNQQITQ
jgi:hypothetical protein